MSLCFYCGVDSPSRYCCVARASEASEFDDLHSLCERRNCKHKLDDDGHCNHSDFRSESGHTIQTICGNNVMRCRKHNAIRLKSYHK